MKRASAVLLACLAIPAFAQENKPVPVTVDNFIRAETDFYFRSFIKKAGGVGRFTHDREVAAIDKQNVIRMNRDTLYSAAVFDLDAGPVKITLPEAGKRFMSMMMVNQDHYVPVVIYGAGDHSFTRKQSGARYLMAAVRTLVDPADPKDLQAAHALQDAIKVEQKAPGRFEAPNWDETSQKKVRDALLVLTSTLGGLPRAFGARGQVDPVHHLLGTAAGWGGNPEKDATYLSVTPARNDGSTIHRLVVKEVPVDAFWSISVYNAQGFFEKNTLNAYSVNNLTAKKDVDGSVPVQFGGCDGKVPNCIPIVKGWNYAVRLYRPRAEILNGKWKFPEAQP